jgi:hypothetical protein
MNDVLTSTQRNIEPQEHVLGHILSRAPIAQDGKNVAKHWPMEQVKELRHLRFELAGAPQIEGRAPVGDSLYQRQ